MAATQLNLDFDSPPAVIVQRAAFASRPQPLDARQAPTKSDTAAQRTPRPTTSPTTAPKASKAATKPQRRSGKPTAKKPSRRERAPLSSVNQVIRGLGRTYLPHDKTGWCWLQLLPDEERAVADVTIADVLAGRVKLC